MMVRVRPERFSPGTLKKLHAQRMSPYKILRRFGYNAYELDMPRDLRINLVFNVEDLTLYGTLVAYPMTISDEPTSTFRSPQSFLVQLSLPPPLRRPQLKRLRVFYKTRPCPQLMAPTIVIWYVGVDGQILTVLGCRPRRLCSSIQSFYMTFTVAIPQRRTF